MTDQQIVPGAGSTPVAITLDIAQRLLPKLAFASFDGSGAAGDFLPVVKFVGPGGMVAGQAVGDVVTAGASVDQTWFRGLAKGGAVAAPTSREQLQSNAALSIPATNADYLHWDHLDGVSLLDLTNPQQPKVKAAGVYGITTTIGVDPMPAGASYYHQLSAGSPGFPVVVTSAGPATAAQSQPWATCTMVSALRVNEPLFAYVYNYAAVALNFYIYRAIVQRIS